MRKIQQFSVNHITCTVKNIYKYSKIIRNDSSTKEHINICNSQVFKTIVKTLSFILLRQTFVFLKSIYFMVSSVFAMRIKFLSLSKSHTSFFFFFSTVISELFYQIFNRHKETKLGKLHFFLSAHRILFQNTVFLIQFLLFLC